ncbi:hypothetical protein BO71DRAFT_399233 [Aspergillus ellipticus CBS 707.79]|uniref:Uncharacterized protein n=1 Tax=Aspergillus ellipticus CBS 707.79 TaxID=1448320 RepID=A0A319D9Y3_9EURO|nr:hypothetical protein BO71DRAFT_399233 [Aspergillus ellipticus CBS 707.79]
MSVSWEVTAFAVQTSTADQRTDALYANGRMQVPVIVSVRAINGSTGASYQLTNAELERIQLVDYFSSATEITGTWFYSTTENEFSHSLSGTREPVVPIVDGAQSIFFWVSSTRVENRNIAARITQPNNTTITTAGAMFNSFVTLNARQPVAYTTGNVTLGDSESTAEGIWKSTFFTNQVSHVTDKDWQQETYSLTTNFHPVLKAELFDFNTNGNQAPNNGWRSTSLTNSFAYRPHRALDVFYFWAPGAQATRHVGVFHQISHLDVDQNLNPVNFTSLTTDARANVQVNQKRNAFCFTHMKFLGTSTWGNGWQMDAWFRLYDTFGNIGEFYPRVREETDEDGAVQNTLFLQNKNTGTSSTEAAALKPTAKL